MCSSSRLVPCPVTLMGERLCWCPLTSVLGLLAFKTHNLLSSLILALCLCAVQSAMKAHDLKLLFPCTALVSKQGRGHPPLSQFSQLD